MGSLVQKGESSNFDYQDSQPQYKDVACGHFNTVLLTNENRIEVYGKYYQIDQNGDIVGPKEEDIIDGVPVERIVGITGFVPQSVQALAGTWDVLYGCTFYCEGLTFLPIIEALYNKPSEDNTVKIVKSSCDYSICVTNGNDIYVWGDASMVPGSYNKDLYVPGQTADTVLSIPGTEKQNITIKNVAAGINSFYIHYTVTIPGTSFLSNKVYSYTRYNKQEYGGEFPTNLQGKPIIDISAGYGFAMTIYADGVQSKTWDWDSFPEDHKKYQYKNFPSLPFFLKRDA